MADADVLCVTDIDVEVLDADAFAPEIPEGFEIVACLPDRGWLTSQTSELAYRFTLYAKPELASSPVLADLASRLP